MEILGELLNEFFSYDIIDRFRSRKTNRSMHLEIQDKSTYLKGLLIIAKKDNVLSESEEEILKKIASHLGFSTDFYEYTIQNLLSNEYLSEDPVQFTEEEIARSFILDGLKLAHADSNTDEREIIWLRQTALKNNISEGWFENKLKEIKRKPLHMLKTDFALLSLI